MTATALTSGFGDFSPLNWSSYTPPLLPRQTGVPVCQPNPNMHINIAHNVQWMSCLMMSRWVTYYGWNVRRQSRDAVWFVMVGFQVCRVYSYFNSMIRLQNVIMFSSSKTFGECESWALELLSGPLPYLRCARRALGKRSEAVTVERLLFHMTDFSNCSKINLWQERKAAAAAGWRGLWMS